MKKDSPIRWKAWDQFNEACLWGALHGVFNLSEDRKARGALLDGDITLLKKLTAKRIKAIGKKPKFKKVPFDKRGYPATTVKGSMAHAMLLYEQEIYGRKISTKKAHVPKKAKKNKVKIIERKPIGPPNPDLPQNNAYAQARKKVKKNEILLYVVHKNDLVYTAIFYNKKTKKRRKVSITAIHVPYDPPWIEQARLYAKKLAKYNKAQKKKRKARDNGGVKVRKAKGRV